MHSDIEEIDEDLLSKIEFRDPMSAIVTDMWVSYQHIFNVKCAPSAIMLVRPRLSKNDLYDMIDYPEHIQLFQHRDWAACLSLARRYKVSQRAIAKARGLIWRKMRGRQVPRPRL